MPVLIRKGQAPGAENRNEPLSLPAYVLAFQRERGSQGNYNDHNDQGAPDNREVFNRSGQGIGGIERDIERALVRKIIDSQFVGMQANGRSHAGNSPARGEKRSHRLQDGRVQMEYHAREDY